MSETARLVSTTYNHHLTMASNLATTDAGQQHQYMSGHDTSGTTGNQYTNDNQYTNGHDSTTRDGVVPARLVKHQGTVSQVNDPTFFKIANPGPLGLISFGVTTFCLGLYQCGAGYASKHLHSLNLIASVCLL